MTPRPLPIPAWAPIAAAAAFVIWAASIWWMVATLPTGGDTGSIEAALDAVVAELESANATLDGLGEQVATLEAERDALDARVHDLEERGPLEAAFEMTTGEGGGTGDQAGEDAPESSPFFTDGDDRYNCHDFSSAADAQEAFEVNGPTDPNRIDMNRNGVACEDFTYPASTATAP